MTNSKTLLSSADPFSAFDDSIVERFLAEAGETRFAAGDEVFHELGTGDEIYFITEGRLRISVELASAYHMSESIEIGPGALVGEVRFIDEGPRPATVTALSDVRALVWNVAGWQAIAEEHPAVGYRLALAAGRLVYSRVRQLQQHLIDDLAWGIE